MSDTKSKTPNEIDDIPTRLSKAMEFLKQNPDEKPITATRIYKLPPSSLYSAIDRAGNTGIVSRGGQNKILMPHHEVAVREFAMSLLSHGIQPTPQLIFQAIIDLKRAQNPTYKAPSPSWFTKWYEKAGLKRIKSKPIAIVRFVAQDKEQVRKWFRQYRYYIGKYRIQRQDVHNFDKAGFRVGMMSGQWILVDKDYKGENYVPSPENRRSVTAVEECCASRGKPIPLFVIVQGKYLMVNWFYPRFKLGAVVVTLEK
jgi:hypothetical protein